MRMLLSERRDQGFQLVELVVGLAVVALVAGFAVAPLVRVSAATRVRAGAAEVYASYAAGRAGEDNEVMRRSSPPRQRILAASRLIWLAW